MKKTLSVILATVLLLTTSALSADENAVSPTPSPWAAESVVAASKLGILGNDLNYRQKITREQFCILAANYYEAVSIAKLTVATENKFTDTDNPAVLMLSGMKIINGKSETEFAPDEFLSREEAATILFRLADKIYPDWAAHQLYYEFDDEDEISPWAMNNIQIICNMGIMNGVGENKFAPKSCLTVEQAIVCLMRMYTGFDAVHNLPEGVIGHADTQTEIYVSDSSFADTLNAYMPTDTNYMFSPLSLKMALAMAANGACGQTKAEILNALEIEKLDDFNSLSEELIRRYSQTDALSLRIANSVWINSTVTKQNFSDEYKEITSRFYNADVGTVDSKNAAKEINAWVSDKTDGKITQIVQDSDDFAAMLVNAIYFKGAWQNEFKESATRPDEFTNIDGTKAQIDFMNKTDWFDYAAVNSAQIVKLPYKNRFYTLADDDDITVKGFDDLDISMYLIGGENVTDVEACLDAALSSNLFGRTYLALSVPKFKIEYTQSFNDIFQSMGVKAAFSPERAQFEDMFDSGSMFFTDILHKTFISVDEKGTEAAAVTSVRMAGSSLPPEPTPIKFDTPFSFVIRDNTSGEILFMGRFACTN